MFKVPGRRWAGCGCCEGLRVSNRPGLGGRGERYAHLGWDTWCTGAIWWLQIAMLVTGLREEREEGREGRKVGVKGKEGDRDRQQGARGEEGLRWKERRWGQGPTARGGMPRTVPLRCCRGLRQPRMAAQEDLQSLRGSQGPQGPSSTPAPESDP